MYSISINFIRRKINTKWIDLFPKYVCSVFVIFVHFATSAAKTRAPDSTGIQPVCTTIGAVQRLIVWSTWQVPDLDCDPIRQESILRFSIGDVTDVTSDVTSENIRDVFFGVGSVSNQTLAKKLDKRLQ